MTRARAATAIPAAVLLISGCSVVPSPELPNWNVYSLEAASAPAPEAPAAGPVAIVTLPESGAGYGTPRMAYLRADGRIEYFAEHRWADSPGHLVAPLFQEALTRTGVFSAVAAMPTRAVADLVIESRVLIFRQEPEVTPPTFRVRIAVTVVQSGAAQGTHTRVFEAEEPMAAAVPAEGVAAARRAVERLLDEAAEFCAEVARGRSPAGTP